MPPRKETTPLRKTTAKDKEAFRRGRDIERLARLEYIVYEDHSHILSQHDNDIREISNNYKDITNHLKIIKYTCLAFLIGAAAQQIGFDKLVQLLALLGA